jgi:hypothetical protein
MNPQEKELLERFLADMTATRAGQKDPEAEALIREAAARQPDALYLLVQRAIQLDQAFQLTQTEVQRLQGELERARAGSAGGSGFLSDPYAWGSQSRSAAPSAAAQTSAGAQLSVSGQPLRPVGAGQTQAAQQPVTAAAQQQPAAAARPGGWGGSGMLGTMAGTAAGVVGGAFLFQGIQNLMHHNDPATAAKDAHPPANDPQSLAADSHTQEPFLLNDPALSEESAAADTDDAYASDDSSGDDGGFA